MKKIILSILMLVSVASFAMADQSPTPSPESQKLQNALGDLITKTMIVAGDAKDFALKEAPDIIKQFLAWKIYENLFWGIITAVIAFVSWKYYIRLVKFAKVEDFEEGWILVAFLGIAIVLFSLWPIGCFSDAIEILVAPKVYLLEAAKHFVK